MNGVIIAVARVFLGFTIEVQSSKDRRADFAIQGDIKPTIVTVPSPTPRYTNLISRPILVSAGRVVAITERMESPEQKMWFRVIFTLEDKDIELFKTLFPDLAQEEGGK